jgi:transposase
MIRLSDVKVRPQYRWRVRQRLMVLHFARLHGPTAAARRCGVSARTIRRWRVRWRQDAVQGLVPRYPRRRGRRITPRVIELIGQARRDLAYGAQRTQLWLRRVHEVRMAVGTIQRIFREYRPGSPAPHPEAGPPADEVVREGGAWRKRSGRREIREDRRPLGLSVHRPR